MNWNKEGTKLDIIFGPEVNILAKGHITKEELIILS